MEPSNGFDDTLAKAVGEKFLLEYYHQAAESSAGIVKFYAKNAVCSFGDGAPVVGTERIEDKLKVLVGASFDLATGGVTCSFQPTPDNGVFIAVSGFVALRSPSGEYGPYRRFMQTFLLGRKDTTSHRFAIVNDIHHFVNTTAAPEPLVASNSAPKKAEEAPKPAAAPTERAAAAKPAPAPAAAASVPAPAQAPAAASNAAPAKSEVAPAQPSKPQRNKQSGTQQGTSAAEKKAEAAPAKPSGPPSYSQVAAKSSPSQPASQAAAPVQAKPAEAKQDAAKEKDTNAAPAAAQGTSLFIKNGQSVAATALSETLAKFGTVVSTSNRGNNTIVVMGSAKEAEAAAASKEVSVGDAKLVVEIFRGSSNRGSSRGGSAKPAEGKPKPAAKDGSKPSSGSRPAANGTSGKSERPRGNRAPAKQGASSGQ